jgi:hypothetical protein
MAHLVRHPLWGVVDLDTQNGRVFVQEEWRYVWHVEAGARAWTLSERRLFHHTADAHIWGRWSDRLRVRPSGTHPLAHAHRNLPVEFDIRWVLRGGQWTVHVTKIHPGGASPRSYVDFPARTIHLDTLDVVPHGVVNDAHQSRPHFYTIPHEFGHTLPERGGSAAPIDDEYNAGHAFLADTDSLMNIGNHVRSRHIQAVVDELNQMRADLHFVAAP